MNFYNIKLWLFTVCLTPIAYLNYEVITNSSLIDSSVFKALFILNFIQIFIGLLLFVPGFILHSLSINSIKKLSSPLIKKLINYLLFILIVLLMYLSGTLIDLYLTYFYVLMYGVAIILIKENKNGTQLHK